MQRIATVIIIMIVSVALLAVTMLAKVPTRSTDRSASATSYAPLVPVPAATTPLSRARAIGPLPAAQPLAVDLVLRHSPLLGKFLKDLYAPGSPYYHHFLRPGQFETRFGPGAPAIHAVETSLDSAHLHPRLTGSIISIHASARTVESALHTRLERYLLPNGRLVFSNFNRPELPASAAKYIQAIVGLSTPPQPQPLGSSQTTTPVAQPGTRYALCSTPAGLFARLPQKSLPEMFRCPPQHAPSPAPSESPPSTAGSSKHAYTISRPLVTGEPAACNAASSLAETSGSYTAGQIAQAYGFTAAYRSGHFGAGETMALYELAPYSASSVSTFENCYGISTSVTSISVDGGTAAGTGDSTTATLDIEEAASLAPDAGILVYEGPDNTPTGPLDTYNAIAAQDRAQVVSTAWGICESAIPKSYAQAENAIFEQMAAQGQTVFASAGSSGSEGCAKQSNSSSIVSSACPFTTTCLASGSNGTIGIAVGIKDASSTPTLAGTPVDVPGTSTLDAIACPVPASSTTSTTCVAAGYSYVSSTSTEGIIVALSLSLSGAVSAGTPVAVPGLTPFYGIACTSSTSCIAAGEAVGYSLEAVGYNLEGVTVPVTLSSDGTVSAGTPVDVSTAISFNTISCASSTSCVAGGYTYVANTTSEEAVAVPVGLSSDGTVSAGAPVAVPGLWILYSMACPLSTASSTTCVAAGADTNSTQGAVIPITISASGTPSAGTPVYIPGTISLNSISCPSSTICEAVGETANGEGIVIPVTLSSSGAVSAGTPVDASGTTALNGLICSASTTCETVGRGTNGDGAIVAVTLSASGIPSAGTPVDVSGTSSFNDIVCPRQANCVAAGWTRAQATGKEGVITPVAISASGTPSAGTPVDVSGTFSLIGLACPSSATCEAVGEAPGVGVHKGGTAVPISLSSSGIPSAGTPVDVSGTSALYNIACTSSTSCVAAGYNYFASTGNYAGTILPITLSSNGLSSIGTLTDVSGTSVLYDLACISSASCVVIGETYRYSMESIMVPMTVSPSGIPSTGTPVTVPGLWILDAIACTSSTSSTPAGTCVATGQSAGGEGVAVPVALSSNGTVSTGTPVYVSGTISLDAIACTSSTSSTSAGTCVATGKTTTNSAIEGVAVPVALSSNGTVSTGTPVYVSGTISLDAIACTSSTSSTSAGTCVATGGSTNIGSIIVRTVNGVPDAPSTAVAPANFLNVQDPASQPYVTSVGGTTLSAVGPPPAETAWNNTSGAGGGGISTFWVMPSWQHGSGVISQNSSGIPCDAPAGSYCREVPDVSASADPNHGYVFYYGTWETAGGTGAATIVWAAATVLANEGCSAPTGFADPALYSHPSDLNNVTGGNNDWTGTQNGLYPATAGYNMATGLGTPTATIFTTGFLCSSTASHPAISSITPDSSTLAGGGTATIVGSGLAGVTAVHFGAIAATDVKSVSSSEVTATIPAASTPGATGVTVTTPTGTTSPSGFVYVTSGLSYMPLVPYRIADTRCAASPQPSFCKSENIPSQNILLASPGAGGSITVQVTGTGSTLGSVPPNAQSAVLNVTAVASQSAHPGYLTVYPAGTDPPTASSLNYVPGEAVPNLVTATIGKDGAISILSSSAGVNIVVDVEGYYGPSLPAGSRFNPLPLPVRVLDTRCDASPQPSFCKSENIPSQNMTLHAPGPGKSISISITGIDGSSGIPSSGVTAVSLVATSAGPSSGGYMTLWPDTGSCSTPPMASNVNFHKGAASANSVTVASGNYGKLCIYNSASTATNAVIDVNGYFSSTGDTFTPSSPVRICDTRDVQAIGGTGDVTSGVTGRCANSGIALDPSISSTDPMTVQVAGEGGVPLSAKAIVANVTVTGTTGNGYLKIWPAGASQPPTSSMNWIKGEAIPNMAVARLANSGQVAIYTSTGADVIIDVTGWYS